MARVKNGEIKACATIGIAIWGNWSAEFPPILPPAADPIKKIKIEITNAKHSARTSVRPNRTPHYPLGFLQDLVTAFQPYLNTLISY
jgi:hypothetical protein